MSTDPRPLDQIQRWLQAVITHPDGVAAGIESETARSEIDVPAERVEQIVERSKMRTGIERLEVYANAYYARLLECLRDEFPALLHAIGEEVFDGLAFGYLQAYPSTSYTLSKLGEKFPDYLAETRPRDEEVDDGPSWPDFMIDLARLERTYSEIFDGRGPERLTLLNAEQIRAIPPEKWPAAQLVPVPCLRLLSLRFPVHEYATGVRKNENPPIPEVEPTWLAVSRIDYVVRRWSFSQIQHGLLQSLLAGESVGRAIEKAAAEAAENGQGIDDLAAHLRDWFEEWAAAGFFQAVKLTPPERGTSFS